MTDNFSNFQDFLDLKSPDIFRMESNNQQHDFLQMQQSNYEPADDFLMRIETQHPDNGFSAIPSENNTKFESLSTKSGYSTNYSIKHSPDYQVDEESSGNSDLNNHKWSQNPPIHKKTINKNYEPIYDGKKCYKYEDDPAEYKKARKRIQNRESASRVRSRKKNYVEVVEQDIYSLKKENAELQLKNAALTAENNLLKQQISFLERMVMKNNSNSSVEFAPEATNNSNSLLPIHKNEGYGTGNEDTSKESGQGMGGFMRMAPNHPFKKHVTMLGVVTLLLCVFGFATSDPGTGGAVSNQLTMEAFKLLSVKDADVQTNTSDTLSLYSKQMEQLINNYIQTQEKSLTVQIFKIVAVLGYVFYFGYVCLVAKRTVFRGKLKYF